MPGERAAAALAAPKEGTRAAGPFAASRAGGSRRRERLQAALALAASRRLRRANARRIPANTGLGGRVVPTLVHSGH